MFSPVYRLRSTSQPVNVSDLISEALDKEFEELFQELYPMAYRTAYGVVGNSQDAEDVAQTIFLKLLRRKFPPELQKNPRRSGDRLRIPFFSHGLAA